MAGPRAFLPADPDPGCDARPAGSRMLFSATLGPRRRACLVGPRTSATPAPARPSRRKKPADGRPRPSTPFPPCWSALGQDPVPAEDRPSPSRRAPPPFSSCAPARRGSPGQAVRPTRGRRRPCGESHGNLNQNQRRAGPGRLRPREARRVLVGPPTSSPPHPRVIHVDDIELVVSLRSAERSQGLLAPLPAATSPGAGGLPGHGLAAGRKQRAVFPDISLLPHDRGRGFNPSATHHVQAGHHVAGSLATSGTPVSRPPRPAPAPPSHRPRCPAPAPAPPSATARSRAGSRPAPGQPAGRFAGTPAPAAPPSRSARPATPGRSRRPRAAPGPPRSSPAQLTSHGMRQGAGVPRNGTAAPLSVVS